MEGGCSGYLLPTVLLAAANRDGSLREVYEVADRMKRVLDEVLCQVRGASFDVTFWDGETRQYGSDPSLFSVTFHERIHPVAFFLDPELALGEAYAEGVLSIDGSLNDVLRLIYLQSLRIQEAGLVSLFRRLLVRGTSIRQQKTDIRHHYDLGNDFYRLWLDDSMSYSCAYFETPDDSLEQAQQQKIDHSLRKLQLQPGERLLDIGSGWGALIIRAARRYQVQAVGITLSEEQYRLSRERIRQQGLEGQVEVRLSDYRELAASGETFDKIVSIGMAEHVGRRNLPLYIRSIGHLLSRQGVTLVHTITQAKEIPVNSWIGRYIFPGGYIPSLREIMYAFADSEFDVMDVENLRLHYARTLDHWSERFEGQVEEVCRRFDERFVRMWRLYLRSSAESFRSGALAIHQILSSKGANNTLETTRRYLYRESAEKWSL